MTQAAGDGLALIGGGGHARVVLATLRTLGVAVAAVLDDDPGRWGTELDGVPVRGPVAENAGGFRRGVLAVGDNRARRRLANGLELEWATVVHPRAWVDPGARLGPGTVVFAGAVIQPGASLGSHVIVNTAASIDHDCRLGDFVHVAPGCRLAGAVTVGEGALLGVGSVAVPGMEIGAWAVVGAGAAVVSDLPAGCVATGVPARVRDGADR